MTKVQEKQTQKRKAIIESIIPLLEDKPFSEISVEDICLAAGISVGSFYHYFEKKSDILICLFTRIDIYMEQNVFPAMTASDETDNLRLFAREWLKYIEGTGLEHSRLISTIDATDFTIDGEPRPTAIVLTEHMRRGQQQGSFSKDLSPEEQASLFMIALRGLSLDWTRRNASYSLTQRGDAYIEGLIKALSI